jgi:hypothetical protein
LILRYRCSRAVIEGVFMGNAVETAEKLRKKDGFHKEGSKNAPQGLKRLRENSLF